jgi:phage-related protein
MKPLEWLGDSRDRVRGLASDGRHEVGAQLGRVQLGLEPEDWKPMPSVGIGVNEIRVRAGGAIRAIYVAKFAEAIYVLHVFQKKSRKTSRLDIELARVRYRRLFRERGER